MYEILRGHCPVCKCPGDDLDSIRHQCNKCGTLVTWMYFSRAEYETIYETTYHTTEQISKGAQVYDERYTEHFIAAKARLQLLKALGIKPGNAIDVGCCNGAFVQAAHESGYQIVGIDPHPLNDKIIKGSWRDVVGQYDLITLFDVIEHLLDPRECLVHLKNCLVDGGHLFIETPEFNAPDNQIERHLKPREHICLYSDKAMRLLFDQVGLRLVFFYRPLDATIGKIGYLVKKC